MRIIIGNQYYPFLDGSSASITNSMSDPVPTATLNLIDNTSSISIPNMSEIVIIDDQVIPNPTINLLLNPSLNPYTTNWLPGASGPVSVTQKTGGGVQFAFNAASSGSFGQVIQTGAAVVPGQAYMLSVYLQGLTTPSNIEAILKIQWKDGSGAVLQTTQTIISSISTTLTRYPFAGTAPGSTVFADVYVILQATANNITGTVALTQAQFEPQWLPTLAYPTPWCGPSQTNCQQLPLGYWIRQYRKFAGFVNHTTNQDYKGNTRTVVVNAVGYAWIAGTILGNDSFTSKTDAQIITTLLSKYFVNTNTLNVAFNNLALCTTTNIVTGTTLSSVQLNWDDMRTVFDNLCSQSGFYWTIDYYWNFVYAPPGYFSQPISLICDNSSMPDNVISFPAYNFSAETDGTQPGSNILTIGGTSGSTTFDAQVIDPSVIAQIGINSGYFLPPTTSWMRKVTDNAIMSNSDCTQRGMAELIQYDNPRHIYHLTANVELKAGYGIAVTSNTDGLSQSTELIQQVQAQWIGTSETLIDVWEYQADLGAVNRAATNMISRIFRATTAGSSAPAVSSTTLAVLEPIGVVDGSVSQGTIVSNYAQTILADTPVAYYRLAEITGTIADDLSGNAYQGTTHGSPTLGVATLLTDPADTSDKAMTFVSGSSQYISLPTSLIPTGAHPWSLECWCKINAFPASGAYSTLVAFGNNANQQSAQLKVHNLSGVGTFVLSTFNGDIASGSISTGTIYHVVGTYDGSAIRLYLNGSLVSAPSILTLNIVANYASIGADGTTVAEFFSGTIDEPAFYAYALSATQISNHHAAGI